MGASTPATMMADVETVRIRELRDGDGAAVHELRRISWHRAYASVYTPAEIDALFDGRTVIRADESLVPQDPLESLVAEGPRGIVGMAAFGVLADGQGWLAALYVHPDDQWSGIGRRLWEAAVLALRVRGCSSMQVWTLRENHGARAFYEHRGASPFSSGTFTVGDHPEPEIGYRVSLA